MHANLIVSGGSLLAPEETVAQAQLVLEGRCLAPCWGDKDMRRSD